LANWAAYALACVEVVCESSEKAGVLYNLLEAEMPKFITTARTWGCLIQMHLKYLDEKESIIIVPDLTNPGTNNQ
jgi:hypothetical protein